MSGLESESEEKLDFAATRDVREDEPLPQAKAPFDLRGEVLADRYRLVKVIGTGGMGKVYLAEDLEEHRRYAVKLYYNKNLGKGMASLSNQHAERLAREARLIAMLEHENIVEIFASGVHEERLPYFVMECLDGEDLHQTIKRETRLPWSRARGILLQVLSALEHAHGQGIIHRDIKPQNCFRMTRGRNVDFIKVLDFGLAKSLVGDAALDDESLTKTGMVIGTVLYMSPEQARGTRLDVTTDVYSVGVLAYQLLTGRCPFSGTQMTAVLSQLLTETPAKMAEVAPDAGIPPALEGIVARALAKDPGDRYGSARSFREALAAVPEDAGERAPVVSGSGVRRVILGVGIAAGVLAAGLGVRELLLVRAVEQVVEIDEPVEEGPVTGDAVVGLVPVGRGESGSDTGGTGETGETGEVVVKT
ncbi:MAG: serine/threonine protein kinase, partial [Myxococcales bacterium]|nr:serine/threonine protein kinase [Myxococcales bacterium]